MLKEQDQLLVLPDFYVAQMPLLLQVQVHLIVKVYLGGGEEVGELVEIGEEVGVEVEEEVKGVLIKQVVHPHLTHQVPHNLAQQVPHHLAHRVEGHLLGLLRVAVHALHGVGGHHALQGHA